MDDAKEVMEFGLAIAAAKFEAAKIARTGWNGKGMFLVYVNEAQWEMDTEADIKPPEGAPGYRMLPFLAMKTADNGLVPWLASQTDVLADDWVIVE